MVSLFKSAGNEAVPHGDCDQTKRFALSGICIILLWLFTILSGSVMVIHSFEIPKIIALSIFFLSAAEGGAWFCYIAVRAGKGITCRIACFLAGVGLFDFLCISIQRTWKETIFLIGLSYHDKLVGICVVAALLVFFLGFVLAKLLSPSSVLSAKTTGKKVEKSSIIQRSRFFLCYLLLINCIEFIWGDSIFFPFDLGLFLILTALVTAFYIKNLIVKISAIVLLSTSFATGCFNLLRIFVHNQ